MSKSIRQLQHTLADLQIRARKFKLTGAEIKQMNQVEQSLHTKLQKNSAYNPTSAAPFHNSVRLYVDGGVNKAGRSYWTVSRDKDVWVHEKGSDLNQSSTLAEYTAINTALMALLDRHVILSERKAIIYNDCQTVVRCYMTRRGPVNRFHGVFERGMQLLKQLEDAGWTVIFRWTDRMEIHDKLGH